MAMSADEITFHFFVAANDDLNPDQTNNTISCGTHKMHFFDLYLFIFVLNYNLSKAMELKAFFRNNFKN